ncbi:MAG TPA: hypothetical protein VLK84_24090, partial [Longimicrobium sp.]|nr:hypothetical protein [Longimicrobium sp.]
MHRLRQAALVLAAVLVSGCADHPLIAPRAISPHFDWGAVQDGDDVTINFDADATFRIGADYYRYGLNYFPGWAYNPIGSDPWVYDAYSQIFPPVSGAGFVPLGINSTRSDSLEIWFVKPVSNVSLNVRPQRDFEITCYDEENRGVGSGFAPGIWSNDWTEYRGPLDGSAAPFFHVEVPGAGINRCLMVSRGGSLDDFRFRRQRKDLVVECVGDLGKDRVTRGEELSCQAKTGSASDRIEIETWSFTGTDSRGQPYRFPEKEDGAVADNPWAGKMAISGTVTVKARVNGGERQEKSAVVTVVAREWEDAPIEARVSKVTYAELPVRRRPPAYPTQVRDLGRTDFAWALLDFNQDVFAQISDYGPNHYLVYFKRVPAEVIARVLVHPELETRGEFWRRQASSQPASSTRPACVQGEFDRYIALVLAHEGYPPNPQSHTGVFRSEFVRLAGPQVEELVYPDLAR